VCRWRFLRADPAFSSIPSHPRHVFAVGWLGDFFLFWLRGLAKGLSPRNIPSPLCRPFQVCFSPSSLFFPPFHRFTFVFFSLLPVFLPPQPPPLTPECSLLLDLPRSLLLLLLQALCLTFHSSSIPMFSLSILTLLFFIFFQL